MWFRVKNKCTNPPPCPFSHDDKIKLTDAEKKLCAQEMAIRYAYTGGVQPTPQQRASSKGAGSRSGSVPKFEKKYTKTTGRRSATGGSKERVPILRRPAHTLTGSRDSGASLMELPLHCW